LYRLIPTDPTNIPLLRSSHASATGSYQHSAPIGADLATWWPGDPVPGANATEKNSSPTQKPITSSSIIHGRVVQATEFILEASYKWLSLALLQYLSLFFPRFSIIN